MPTQPQIQPNKRRTESSTQDKNSGKRTRVSRACDQCRTAREKCDGQPTCSTCSASKRSCTYTANPKKRGIQPGYIRTLELALTWLFNNTEAENLLNQKLAQEGAQSALLGKDTKESNKLHRTWRRSRFCRDVDKLLSGGEIGTLDNSRSPESDEEESEPEEEGQLQDFTPNQLETSTIAQLSPEITRLSNLGPRSSLQQAISLPAARWRLFDVYFSYTHSWFPICEKHDILKLTYSYPDTGLDLSSSMADSGDHAELWSILALASIQELAALKTSQSGSSMEETPERFYNIARALIPLELGTFQIGHAKALLLLALVNLSQLAPEAAWLLVGYASRIVLMLQRRDPVSDPRTRHVFAGCFLLDSLISMQLKRPAYLGIADVERIGKVMPDGLEEWQPWTGCLDHNLSRHASRTPALSLSSFNHLVELVGIASFAVNSGSQQSSLQEALGRIELWKASLQPMFEHIRSEQIPVPPTPPAMVLQAFYCSCALLLFSSQSWMQRTVDAIELLRDTLGLVAMPPIFQCLFDVISRSKVMATIEQRLLSRFQVIRNDYIQAWSIANESTLIGGIGDSSIPRNNRPGTLEPSSAHSGSGFGSTNAQVPTPESMHVPFNTTIVPLSNSEAMRPRTNSTLLDDILPDINANPVAGQSMDFNNAKAIPEYDASQFSSFHAPALDHGNSAQSRDIENFFDELASLDGAERIENQPQFMQNLGFAPDANIADLLSSDFGQINPLVSPYIHQTRDNTSFDQAGFFNGG